LLSLCLDKTITFHGIYFKLHFSIVKEAFELKPKSRRSPFAGVLSLITLGILRDISSSTIGQFVIPR